ncbi:type IV pilus assembly protein PilA [Paenibacillus castaneae]|uniref:type II secretion system protein n=1 Tax=Paenibacillus castaneae TaxID=474957 RepID=UPI001ABB5D41|nr:type II secretion system protein [Paenibacillus castaneae]NIK77298.1 type IV pilus assembly protein PilA [Paenibacillus castaneae]
MQMILKRLKKEEKGFTLIELLAVIVILAVIAVIAVPLIGNIINKTKTDANIATARQIYDAARLYATADKNGVFGDFTIKQIQDAKYLEDPIYLPSTKKEIDGSNSVFKANANDKTFLIIYTNDSSTTIAAQYSKAEIMSSVAPTP